MCRKPRTKGLQIESVSLCVCVYSNDCVTIYIYEFVIAFQETWKTGTLNATF